MQTRRESSQPTSLFWILVGLLAASLLGELVYRNIAGAGALEPAVRWFSQHGSTLFIGALTWPIIPLVFCAIYVVVRDNANTEMLGTALKACAFFLCSTVIAVCWGLLSASVFEPGAALEFGQVEKGSAGTSQPSPLLLLRDAALFWEQLREWWAMRSWSQKLTTPPWFWVNLLHLIGFTIVFSIAATVKSHYLPIIRPLKSRFDKGTEFVLNIVVSLMLLILKLLPFGVFCAVLGVVSASGLQTFTGPLGLLVVTAAIAMALHLSSLISVVFMLKRLSLPLVFAYQRTMAAAGLTGFLSRSSMGTLPVTLSAAELAGIPTKIRNFIFPFGATVNMDGTTCYLAVCVLAFFQSQGIELTIPLIGVIIVTLVGASIGTAAAPSASLVLLALVLGNLVEASGTPVDEAYIYGMVAFVLAIDFLGDMFRTATNIMGDAQCALFLTPAEDFQPIAGAIAEQGQRP